MLFAFDSYTLHVSKNIVLPVFNYFYSLRILEINRIDSLQRLFSGQHWSTITEYNTENITFVSLLLSNAIVAMWLICLHTYTIDSISITQTWQFP
jgi:hypothetical protein